MIPRTPKNPKHALRFEEFEEVEDVDVHVVAHVCDVNGFDDTVEFDEFAGYTDVDD